MRRLAIVLLVPACVEHGSGGPVIQHVDAGGGNATCPMGNETKIKFTQAQGCGNDGSVEFCIPANDGGLRDQLASIHASISCIAGGGRAGCLRTPDLLLCSYKTAVPTECITSHGAMTDTTWGDMCAIASFPQIVEIVPTIFE